MIKKSLFLLVILLAFIYSCKQRTITNNANFKNDSIQKYLALASNDTLAADKMIKYNKKATALLDLEKSDSTTREYLNSVVFNYLKVRDIPNYKKYSSLYFEKVTQTHDTLGLARYYRYKASFFNYLTIYDSSFYYYLKSEKFYKKIKNEDGLAFINFNKSIIQFHAGNYIGAELSLMKALPFFKKANKTIKIYGVFNQLGLVYNELNDLEKSLYYHKKALGFVFQYNINDKDNNASVCYNNIGYVYLKSKKYNEAIINFELGLRDKKIIEYDVELYALLKSNLASSKLKNGDNKDVLKLLNEALAVKKKLIARPVLTNIYILFSKYYESIGKHQIALDFSEKSLKEAENSQLKTSVLEALIEAAIINKDKSKIYIEKYIETLNVFQLEELKSRDRFDRIQLETNEIAQEKENALKQKSIIMVIALTLLVICILVFVIARQRIKQRQLLVQQTQQKANEEIYSLMLAQKTKEDEIRSAEKKRIALELHDGVMNKLASTRLNLSALSHNTDEVTIANCIKQIDGIYNVEQEIRTIAHDLNQDVFQKENSFIIILENFVAEQNKISNTHFELQLDHDIDWNKLSGELKMNMYRIIQEASNNIIKYANAQKATVTITLDYPNICMLISDDGIGFDTTITHKGIGIQNMQTRIKRLNGKINIKSSLKKDTTISIVIPIETMA